MKISEILDVRAILPDIESDKSKEEILKILVNLVCQVYKGINGKDEIVKTLIEREKLKSTGIEDGLAIPHGKFPKLQNMIAAFGRSEKGVDFNSMDGKPTHFLVLILAPERASSIHLKSLARISRMFKDKEFRNKLLVTSDPEQIYKIFLDQELKNNNLSRII
ncbi:MAG: hypothetical protein A2161_21260 [Candidatus Schekmanbacteria bacterium RBG_13_48_7]|uniref:PTS EIIA type-2 domain-containing protein n=1 Tax=Candidatus Schekmanbacteria bacterium RBG_13_48_7 TaxID=1817878 RepID=A0A1F7RVT4_9BACT|nr:MAG: hypothetical protein A2161_21260 [Candidatus Schekmanbacteria bacterium RBG_13_48_7]